MIHTNSKGVQQFAFLMLLLVKLFTGSSLAAQATQPPAVQKTPVQLSIDSLLNKAWATGRSNPSSSLADLKKIEALNEINKPAYKQDVVMYYYGVFYKNMNRFDESESYFTHYEAYQESKGNKRQIANVNMAKANLYSDWGKYDKGMEAATKSIAMYDAQRDTLGVVRAGSKLGFFLLETGNTAEAKKYFEKSIRLSKAIGNKLEEDIGYQNLGLAYEKEINYDDALKAYREGYRIGEEIADDYNKIINRYNMANILFLMKRYDEALPYTQASLQLADSIQIPSLAAASRQMMAQLQIAKGQPDEALTTLEKMAAGEGKNLGLKDKMEMYGLLVEGYQAKGDVQAAFDNLKIYKELNDSLLSSETRKRINELEIQYETEKKKQQIALLQAENNLNALELKREAEKNEALQTENRLKAEKLRQQEMLNLALQREKILADSNLAKQELINMAMLRENLLKQRELEQEQEITLLLSSENELKEKNLMASRRSQQQLGGGLIGLALLGSLIFYLYQQQKVKNKIIAKQSEDLQVLNREIHHRVKNNLQVVSSMLDLQAETIPDEEMAGMFREGSKRVQSMAFIHQNLYQGDSANSVHMPDYIRMLTEHLFEAYNIRPGSIKLTTDIEPMKLHTDTVIPIGMILNELISNGLKYAFDADKQGEMQVILKQQGGDKLWLSVKDNGRGLPPHFNPDQLNSFGYKIIRAFSRKLKAELDFKQDGGTEVSLLISKFKRA